VSHPPPGQPWYPGQPEQNQPQYGGYPGGPGPDPYSGGPAYGQQPQPPYGNDPNYGGQPYSGGPAYPPESYTTEPPYSGQPYPGQPYPGDSYAAQQQPAYDPGYPQQQAYPPAQPYSTPGMHPGMQPGYPPPQRRGRGGIIALVVGGVILLLLICGIGSAVLLTSNRDSTKNAESTATPTPTSTRQTSPSPTSAVKPEYPATIDLPKKLAGMDKLEDPQLNATANETALKIKNETNADTAIAGYYAPPGDLTRTVGLVGAAVRVGNPTAELDQAFKSALGVTSVRDVAAGSLGGVMKCGNTSSGGTALTVCGWADGGSLVLGIFLNRSLDDSAVLLRQIRSEILHRG
jgi:hypothetical protein